ncbi:MAG: type II toxin-antitoxin system death-on-curing family toxin [Gemmatimonadetes bacterium]|nr:type II toxin-antitoxin system death-on-curing family toxin [Gemmatimonadota bacterium]
MARRTEPRWLDRQTVEAIHAMVVVQSGGSAGLRDAGLLESAIARAQQHWAYNDSADLFDLAAALGAGLARNHPFVDGNKRIAFVATVTFLELNGARFNAGEAEAVLVMLEVATGKRKEPAFAEWLRANTRKRRR